MNTRNACLLLVNKADLLTSAQLEEWRNYFRREGIRAVFWSALRCGSGSSPTKQSEELQEDGQMSSSSSTSSASEESLGADDEDKRSNSEEAENESVEPPPSSMSSAVHRSSPTMTNGDAKADGEQDTSASSDIALEDVPYVRTAKVRFATREEAIF